MSKMNTASGGSTKNDAIDRIPEEQGLRLSDTAKSKSKRKNPDEKTIDDLGPTLTDLKWWRKIYLVFNYALRHQRLPIAIMVSFISLVILGVLFWGELQLPTGTSHTPKSIVEWLLNAQTILGIGTLLVALFVWIGEIEEDWENDRPKRLSVFFFWMEKPLIVCRYVWLAGEDEIRTWGQQVAVQAQHAIEGEKPVDSFLHFVPDMQTRNPILLAGANGDVWKHYSICFKLTRLNKSLDRTKDYCRYQNIAGIDNVADNFPFQLVESIPEVARWKQDMVLKMKSNCMSSR